MNTFCIVRRIAPFGWDGLVASRALTNSDGRLITFIHYGAAAEYAAEMQLSFIRNGEYRVKHEVMTLDDAKADLGTAWPGIERQEIR